MDTSIIRRLMRKGSSGMKMFFVILLWVIFLTCPVLIFLFSQGWHRPFHSLHAMLEMREYIEETCAGQDLSIGFPVYNMVMDEFSAIVRDEDGQATFGLCYDGHGGVTERGLIQGSDGNYYISTMSYN